MSKENIYLQVMEKLSHPASPYLERLLRKLMTPEEAELLLALPADTAQLAARFGRDENEIKAKLQEFMERGLVIPSKGELRFARDVARLHDATLSSAEKWVDEQLLDLWKDFYEREWFAAMKEGPKLLARPMIRVIPAWKAIELSAIPATDVPPEQNIRELIKGAAVIAVVPCTCRRSMRRCNAPLHNCMQFNKGAEYAISRGAGRRLSVDQAIAIADEAEEAGLVHTWPFPPSFFEICNCCRDCCGIFDGGLYFGTMDRILEKSNFRARIEQEICNGCESCVERCFFGAIKMTKVDSELKATLDAGKCFGCGLCVLACNLRAITLKPLQTNQP